MSDSAVFIADSHIHGMGLFARTLIPAGADIGTLRGEHTTTDGEHVLWLNNRHGLQVHGDFRYINHSVEPNAVYYDNLEVAALRDIHPGEEITHDYDANSGKIDASAHGHKPDGSIYCHSKRFTSRANQSCPEVNRTKLTAAACQP